MSGVPLLVSLTAAPAWSLLPATTTPVSVAPGAPVFGVIEPTVGAVAATVTWSIQPASLPTEIASFFWYVQASVWVPAARSTLRRFQSVSPVITREPPNQR